MHNFSPILYPALDAFLQFKGQLISECLLGVIDFPKQQQQQKKSALETKKWSNQQSKSTF